MSIDQTWLDRNAARWAKLDRAQVHLRSLRDQVEGYPYKVALGPTDTRSRRLPGARQASSPVAISTIVGDIVHYLRSALDSLAYEIAVRHVGRPLRTRS